MIKIRKYKPEDEQKLKEMIKNVLKSLFDESFVERLGKEHPWENFQDYMVIYLAEDKDKIIGSSAIKKVNKDVAKLKRMYVSIDYQRKGIGKKLLTKCLKLCSDKKFEKIILTTYPEMKNAVKFYKKNGFRIVKNPSDIFFTNLTLRNYNKRQVAMEKELK